MFCRESIIMLIQNSEGKGVFLGLGMDPFGPVISSIFCVILGKKGYLHMYLWVPSKMLDSLTSFVPSVFIIG